MSGAPHLVGGNVIVRRFAESDLSDTYVGWLNDPEVVKYSNQRFKAHSLASCRAYFESFAGSDNLFLAICLADGRMVGTMTVYRAMMHGTADVGIMLGDRTIWGQGVGQKAWSMVIDWLLGLGDIRKVTAGTLGCNSGMLLLMQRAGMQQEAVRRAQEIVDGVAQDVIYYARFRN